MNGAFRESIRDDSTLVYEVYEPVLRYVAYISSVNQPVENFHSQFVRPPRGWMKYRKGRVTLQLPPEAAVTIAIFFSRDTFKKQN